jgi:hypothetical protein
MWDILTPPLTLEEAAQKCLQRVAFFDKVTLWFADRPPRRVRDRLAARCRGGIIWHDGPMSYRDAQGQQWKRRDWRYKGDLLQPTPQAFQYLMGRYPAREQGRRQLYLINGCEVALDLITASRHDAWLLHDCMEMYLVKRWHGKQRLKHVGKRGAGGTTYYGQRRKGPRNDLALYSDKPSKVVAGQPCCHLEWRAQSAQALRRLGIATVADLAGFAFRSFWERRLVLKQVSSSLAIGKAILGQRRRKHPSPDCARVGQLFLRGHAQVQAQSEDGGLISAQLVIDHGRRWQAQRCLKPLPNTAFVPESGQEEGCPSPPIII